MIKVVGTFTDVFNSYEILVKQLNAVGAKWFPENDLKNKPELKNRKAGISFCKAFYAFSMGHIDLVNIVGTFKTDNSAAI